MRIGHGYDAHRFDEGGTLLLGGVTIPYPRGLLAHSDGDVLIHALCDALLGAAGLGDIGQHFPDSSADYKNVDSRELLRHVVALLSKHGLTPGNADMTIIAQAPKLAPFIAQMRTRLAADLCVAAERINIKATTTEKMGFAGRSEGIAAHAVVLLNE
ncbi:MAG: 2-C-methyl-D-erythritol 2,4-cyclodiphosphate synthase [Gammaproteobacteria bacterium]|nr:2-C-methyl-D-erythritol 2,4-cyclodiphosphate synthase [Gammaproteobacteria bacterium]